VAPLPREFYARPTLSVARELLGQRLVRVLDGCRLAGRIVEVAGKLCQALAIDRTLNRADLCQGETIWIEADTPIAAERIATGPRIGIRGDEHALGAPWRFFLRGHPNLSH